MVALLISIGILNGDRQLKTMTTAGKLNSLSHSAVCAIWEEHLNGELISAGWISKPVKNRVGVQCPDSLQQQYSHLQVLWYGINHYLLLAPDSHLYLIYRQRQLRTKRQVKDLN